MLQDAGYAFDTESVAPGSLVSIGVDGQADVLPEGADPQIAVERLEVGEGATLALSRYPLIIARDLRIHAGARLLLRDGGHAIVNGDLDAAGLGGGTVTIVAQTVVIDGALDAAGNDGDPNGGLGGHLILRTEELAIGENGAILLDGGDGADGEHERRIETR